MIRTIDNTLTNPNSAKILYVKSPAVLRVVLMKASSSGNAVGRIALSKTVLHLSQEGLWEISEPPQAIADLPLEKDLEIDSAEEGIERLELNADQLVTLFVPSSKVTFFSFLGVLSPLPADMASLQAKSTGAQARARTTTAASCRVDGVFTRSDARSAPRSRHRAARTAAAAVTSRPCIRQPARPGRNSSYALAPSRRARDQGGPPPRGQVGQQRVD